MHTVPVWDGKYEEFGRRREVDVAALSDPTLINFQPPMRALRRFLVALMLICHSSLLFGQSTAFTYQGRLNDGSNPADGSYDLRFAVFDKSTNGNQQGPILTNGATSVSNGLFNVVLDFGNQFSGPDRWLEIAVRTNGNGNFITLSPRQPVTATPYAITAANVLAGGIPSGIYTNAVIFSNPGNQFAGNGRELTNLNAANVFGTFTGNGANLTNLPSTTATNFSGNMLNTVTNIVAASVPGLLAANLSQPTWYLFDGDSLTSGNAVGWHGQVSDLTNHFMPPYSQWVFKTNAATDGESLHTMLAQFTNNILPWMPDRNAGESNAMVTLWGGVNDNGTYPAYQTISDISNYVGLVHRHGGKITVLTVPTASNWLPQNVVPQQMVNAFIRNFTNIDRVVDVARIFPAYNPAWCLDNVHFNTNSDWIIAQAIFAAWSGQSPPPVQGDDFNVHNIQSYGTFTGDGSGLTFTNASGAKFSLIVNSTTNGFNFVPQ